VAALTIENLRNQSNWAHEELSKAQTEVEELEEERSGLQYTVKGLIAANQQMADRIKDLEAKAERLNEHRDELDARKTLALLEVRALDEEVERLNARVTEEVRLRNHWRGKAEDLRSRLGIGDDDA
jgi:chromosome segregation ATPase